MDKKRLGIVSVLLVLVLACNLPSNALPANVPLSVPTEAAIPTGGLLAADTSTPTAAPVVLATDTASPTPAPKDPLVLRDTLCWVGPGTKYDVVSALKRNVRAKLLGRGSISGWYIVENPRYHDPCWVAESDLQIDAGTDLTQLKIFSPPPTPIPTRPPATPTPV